MSKTFNLLSVGIPLDSTTSFSELTADGDARYAKLDGTNQPFTGDVEVDGAASDGTISNYGSVPHTIQLAGGAVSQSENTKLWPYSYLLDGSGDYVYATSSVDLSSAASVAFWFRKIDTLSTDCLFELVGDTTSKRTSIWASNSTGINIMSGALRKYQATGGNANTILGTGWNHILLTWAGSTRRLYINGVSWALGGESTADPANATGSMRIGAFHFSTIYEAAGNFSDIRVWNRELTSGEIASLYNAGDGTEESVGGNELVWLHSSGVVHSAFVLKSLGVEKWRITPNGGLSSFALKDAAGTVQMQMQQTTGNVTLAGTVQATDATLTNLTASQILSTDANKKLTSLAVATYPSLTELSYVKGLTSAVQTQLGGKVPYTGATGDVDLGVHGVVLTDLQAKGSGGLAIKADNGDTAVIIGAGGGKNATFYDGVKLDAGTASRVVVTDADKNLTQATMTATDLDAIPTSYLKLNQVSPQTVTGKPTFPDLRIIGDLAVTYDGDFVDTVTINSRVVTFNNDGSDYTSWEDADYEWTPTYDVDGKLTAIGVVAK